MAASVQLPVAARPHPAGEAQLAQDLADAFHLIAQCWSRGLRVPPQLLDQVDALLDRVAYHQRCRESLA